MEHLSIATLVATFGGIGIFLLGMIIMTDGLRTLAGDAMRSALMRFTKSPVSGAVTGMLATVLLQSSNATTVAAVGFVSAGLLTFTQALGIIFGSNIGSTVTGWIVVLLGFELKLGTIMLPFIFLGTLLKLFSKGNGAFIGYTLAGFGLVFIGLDMMQEAMKGFEGIITPELLPSDTILGRFILLILGFVFTFFVQSSSAATATVLTLLYSGAVSFEQSAALIVGMDIGTTTTAALASIGGSANVKRTGFSDAIYNFVIGIAALFLITPFIDLWELMTGESIIENAEIALVAFHTVFNTVGIIIILPFTAQFAQLMKYLIPSTKPKYAQKLDKRLLEKDSTLALEIARSSVEEAYSAMLKHTDYLVGGLQYGERTDLPAMETSLDKIQEYVDSIDLAQKEDDVKWKKVISIIHIIDHMQRLLERCHEEEYKVKALQNLAGFEEYIDGFIRHNALLLELFASNNYLEAGNKAGEHYKEMKQELKGFKNIVVNHMVADEIDMHEGTKELEAIRWFLRVSHHIARISEYMSEAVLETGK